MQRLIPLMLGATFGVVSAVWAEPPTEQNPEQVQAVDYHYGMSLDIQKVIDITDNSDKVGVVPATITYLDSNGKLHKLNYLELGRFDSGD
ncbi:MULTISPECIES: DUF2790 domain-containing protein [unclassified Pseudomonas]|uniref:DUF2790 domain-containing protein n=1 Tax=unclassified Pseudomonas TaxID=196821 RepID=UPI001EDCAB86|nr:MULTISPECIES: DUF2790 domain-containing protein [unclassified Pseudomonas]MCG4454489.1 DUF2790 domain-containing protein [Pseudomonas sp. MMS21 TM103]